MKVLKNGSLLGRRTFLQFAGAATVSLTAAACNKRITNGTPDTIDIGEGNVAALNVLYAIEQFNAAFFSRVLLTPYAEISPAESSLVADMRAHDVAHRDLLKSFLGSDAIPTISLDLSYVDFTSRVKVLAAAQQLKDLAVVAYNSAAYLVGDVNRLSVIFKMASVDARHSSVLHNLASFGSFADANILNDYGMDKTLNIPMVLQTINEHLKKRLSASAFNYMPY